MDAVRLIRRRQGLNDLLPGYFSAHIIGDESGIRQHGCFGFHDKWSGF